MSETKITIKPNAPYKVEGSFIINDNGGVQDITNSTIYLCSCGQSQKKPYCDGSHTKPRTITINLEELIKQHPAGIKNVELTY